MDIIWNVSISSVLPGKSLFYVIYGKVLIELIAVLVFLHLISEKCMLRDDNVLLNTVTL
jgi:hypothetical protein